MGLHVGQRFRHLCVGRRQAAAEDLQQEPLLPLPPHAGRPRNVHDEVGLAVVVVMVVVVVVVGWW